MRMLSPLMLALAVALSAATAAAQFAARLEAVRVDVLVTDGGRIVRGLQPADFEIRDNGVLQQVDLASFEELPLDIVLALDLSESVSGEQLDHLRSAGQAVLNGLTPDDRAGLLTFSHLVRLRQGLTSDAGLLRSALDRLEATGETSLVDGTYAALLLGELSAGRDLAIVFSDGSDTASWLTAEQVLDTARRSDAVVYGVSVRGSPRALFLRDISELTGGAMIEVESTRDLQATFVRILDEFRQRYVVSYTPTGVSREGWHRLEVRVKGRRATVSARAGYFAGP